MMIPQQPVSGAEPAPPRTRRESFHRVAGIVAASSAVVSGVGVVLLLIGLFNIEVKGQNLPVWPIYLTMTGWGGFLIGLLLCLVALVAFFFSRHKRAAAAA